MSHHFSSPNDLQAAMVLRLELEDSDKLSTEALNVPLLDNSGYSVSLSEMDSVTILRLELIPSLCCPLESLIFFFGGVYHI